MAFFFGMGEKNDSPRESKSNLKITLSYLQIMSKKSCSDRYIINIVKCSDYLGCWPLSLWTVPLT